MTSNVTSPSTELAVGARVRVLPDAEAVQALCSSLGTWTRSKAKRCGTEAVIAEVDPNDWSCKLRFQDTRCAWYTHACLQLLDKPTPSTSGDSATGRSASPATVADSRADSWEVLPQDDTTPKAASHAHPDINTSYFPPGDDRPQQAPPAAEMCEPTTRAPPPTAAAPPPPAAVSETTPPAAAAAAVPGTGLPPPQAHPTEAADAAAAVAAPPPAVASSTAVEDAAVAAAAQPPPPPAAPTAPHEEGAEAAEAAVAGSPDAGSAAAACWDDASSDLFRSSACSSPAGGGASDAVQSPGPPAGDAAQHPDPGTAAAVSPPPALGEGAGEAQQQQVAEEAGWPQQQQAGEAAQAGGGDPFASHAGEGEGVPSQQAEEGEWPQQHHPEEQEAPPAADPIGIAPDGGDGAVAPPPPEDAAPDTAAAAPPPVGEVVEAEEAAHPEEDPPVEGVGQQDPQQSPGDAAGAGAEPAGEGAGLVTAGFDFSEGSLTEHESRWYYWDGHCYILHQPEIYGHPGYRKDYWWDEGLQQYLGYFAYAQDSTAPPADTATATAETDAATAEEASPPLHDEPAPTPSPGGAGAGEAGPGGSDGAAPESLGQEGEEEEEEEGGVRPDVVDGEEPRQVQQQEEEGEGEGESAGAVEGGVWEAGAEEVQQQQADATADECAVPEHAEEEEGEGAAGWGAAEGAGVASPDATGAAAAEGGGTEGGVQGVEPAGAEGGGGVGEAQPDGALAAEGGWEQRQQADWPQQADEAAQPHTEDPDGGGGGVHDPFASHAEADVGGAAEQDASQQQQAAEAGEWPQQQQQQDQGQEGPAGGDDAFAAHPPAADADGAMPPAELAEQGAAWDGGAAEGFEADHSQQQAAEEPEWPQQADEAAQPHTEDPDGGGGGVHDPFASHAEADAGDAAEQDASQQQQAAAEEGEWPQQQQQQEAYPEWEAGGEAAYTQEGGMQYYWNEELQQWVGYYPEGVEAVPWDPQQQDATQQQQQDPQQQPQQDEGCGQPDAPLPPAAEGVGAPPPDPFAAAPSQTPQQDATLPPPPPPAADPPALPATPAAATSGLPPPPPPPAAPPAADTAPPPAGTFAPPPLPLPQQQQQVAPPPPPPSGGFPPANAPQSPLPPLPVSSFPRSGSVASVPGVDGAAGAAKQARGAPRGATPLPTPGTPVGDEWVELTDAATGQTYFYNGAQGVSLWQRPGSPSCSTPPPSTGGAAPMPRRISHPCISFGAGKLYVATTTRRESTAEVVPFTTLFSDYGSDFGQQEWSVLSNHPGGMRDAKPEDVAEHVERLPSTPLQRVLAHLAVHPYSWKEHRWEPFIQALSEGLMPDDVKAPAVGPKLNVELLDDPTLPDSERLRRALEREQVQCTRERSLAVTQKNLLFDSPAEAIGTATRGGEWGIACGLAVCHGEGAWKEVVLALSKTLNPQSPLFHSLLISQEINPLELMKEFELESWRGILLALLKTPMGHFSSEAIRSLAERLMATGVVDAAHFCLLCIAARPEGFDFKPVLLGGMNQNPRCRTAFINPQTIFQTEVLEFVRMRTNKGFFFEHLATYRTALACYLHEAGLFRQCLAVLGGQIKAVPNLTDDLKERCKAELEGEKRSWIGGVLGWGGGGGGGGGGPKQRKDPKSEAPKEPADKGKRGPAGGAAEPGKGGVPAAQPAKKKGWWPFARNTEEDIPQAILPSANEESDFGYDPSSGQYWFKNGDPEEDAERRKHEEDVRNGPPLPTPKAPTVPPSPVDAGGAGMGAPPPPGAMHRPPPPGAMHGAPPMGMPPAQMARGYVDAFNSS